MPTFDRDKYNRGEYLTSGLFDPADLLSPLYDGGLLLPDETADLDMDGVEIESPNEDLLARYGPTEWLTEPEWALNLQEDLGSEIDEFSDDAEQPPTGWPCAMTHRYQVSIGDDATSA